MKRFGVIRADLWFQIHFANPSFELFRSVPNLYRELFQLLSPFGLTTANMKFESGDGTVAQACVQCFLLDLNAWVQVWTHRAEVRSSQFAGIDSLNKLERIVVGVSEALKGQIPVSYYTSPSPRDS